MTLERTVSAKAARRPASQPRRAAFSLQPVTSLPRLAHGIAELADRALEPNPFLLPEFLEPAIRAFGPSRLKLATVSDRGELRFFAAVVDGVGLLAGPQLRVWTHPYAPLGVPLMQAGAAAQVGDAVLKYLHTSGRHLIALPDMPLAGAAAKALKAAAARRGFWTEAGRQLRPILHADSAEGLAAFERMASPKRRRELDRQLRKLSETGAVSFMSARSGSELQSAFAAFSALEAAGWKGARGTALKRRADAHVFARAAVERLAQDGRAAVDVLRVGERPVAALIRFEHGGLSIPWKIAYDEDFSSFSPGRQLICDETRRWLSDPAIKRVDPVCEQDNPLFAGLWRETEPYGTLLITDRRWGVGARAKALVIGLRAGAKSRVKSLVSGRPAGARPAARTRTAGPAATST